MDTVEIRSLPVERIACTPRSIDEVVAACLAADGHPPLSEQKILVVTAGEEGDAACWERDGAPIAAAVAVPHRHGDGDEHWAIEVAVAPAGRDDEVTPIVRAAALLAPGRSHTMWAFRDAQQDAARSLGYEAFRELLLMTVPLPAAEPEPATGYRLRTFRPGADEESVAAVNNRAFATHRENDQITAAVIRARESAPWFDQEGFFLAEDEDGIVGFCWTKLHPDGAGEIYIIGVAPAHHGRGLGRWLLLSGLDHLCRGRGAVVGQLWTDADNSAVDRLYRPAGFATRLINREMRPAQPNG